MEDLVAHYSVQLVLWKRKKTEINLKLANWLIRCTVLFHLGSLTR